MIKLNYANQDAVSFRLDSFSNLEFRRVEGEWHTCVVASSKDKDIQQLRVKLALALEGLAGLIRSQEAGIIKTVVEAL